MRRKTSVGHGILHIAFVEQVGVAVAVEVEIFAKHRAGAPAARVAVDVGCVARKVEGDGLVLARVGLHLRIGGGGCRHGTFGLDGDSGLARRIEFGGQRVGSHVAHDGSVPSEARPHLPAAVGVHAVPPAAGGAERIVVARCCHCLRQFAERERFDVDLVADTAHLMCVGSSEAAEVVDKISELYGVAGIGAVGEVAELSPSAVEGPEEAVVDTVEILPVGNQKLGRQIVIHRGGDCGIGFGCENDVRRALHHAEVGGAGTVQQHGNRVARVDGDDGAVVHTDMERCVLCRGDSVGRQGQEAGHSADGDAVRCRARRDVDIDGHRTPLRCTEDIAAGNHKVVG